MRILIGQPTHEEGITQLQNEVNENEGIDAVLYPEGYISNENALVDACALAKERDILIITSYKKDNKDRAVVISNDGKIILERAKTLPDENIELYTPLMASYGDINIGYLLCMEILKGARDFKKIGEKISFIAHPIGVGMFSEEQFREWINEAEKIAKINNTIIVGTSHADGSYRNCGISIPISYCIDNNGDTIYVSSADTRTRIIDLKTKSVLIKENA
ncbi:hypothetical protein [Clostridium paridis]|uniref:CN hydrolase domain-containing protein n=1 Tax=Clostridium paridis TaxID=2803863 RepID=A0A937FEB0_9CLOT|nr:hypothetical protein [Clostridium paridis]MBL4931628.1 hypothetical protein [Clostridium paridis]